MRPGEPRQSPGTEQLDAPWRHPRATADSVRRLATGIRPYPRESISGSGIQAPPPEFGDGIAAGKARHCRPQPAASKPEIRLLAARRLVLKRWVEEPLQAYLQSAG